MHVVNGDVFLMQSEMCLVAGSVVAVDLEGN